MRIASVVRLVLFSLLVHAASAAAQDFTAYPGDSTDPSPGDGICGPRPDNSRCTLRAAIQEVNALGGAHAILARNGRHRIFGPAGDDHAASGDLDIRAGVNLVIRGDGVAEARCALGGCFGSVGETLIEGREIDRVFHVHAGATLRLQDLAIVGGGERVGFDHDIYTTPGGAILNDGGDLTLDNVAIADNRGSEGGGLLNRGRATVRFSLFTNNGAGTHGGAISSVGALEVTQSVVHANGARENGAGVALRAAGRIVVTLRHVALTGNGTTRGIGGGLWVEGSATTATLSEGFVANNQARAGGGVYNTGTLTIDRTTVEGNRTVGIINLGSLAITLTNILRNRGGGISNSRGLTIEASTIANNFTEFDGGGLHNVRTEGFVASVLTNVTISGNRAGRNGGGIYNPVITRDPMKLLFVTITANTAASGSGVFGHTGSFQAIGTVIAGNPGNDCYQGDAFVTSPRSNMDGDLTCHFGYSTGPDPLLGPLADNGGRTLTRAPLDGSAVIDAVPAHLCVDLSGARFRFDQRGMRRPAGATCDAGAFEVTRPVPPWLDIPGVFFDLEIAVGRLELLTTDLLKLVAGDGEAEGAAMAMAGEAAAMSAAFDAFALSQDAFAGADAIGQLTLRFETFTKIFATFEECCAQRVPKETTALGEARGALDAALVEAQAALKRAGVRERLKRLILKISGLPLGDGIKNSLVKQLEAHAFGAFVRHLEAQRGKKIDAATADALIAEATLLSP